MQVEWPLAQVLVQPEWPLAVVRSLPQTLLTCWAVTLLISANEALTRAPDASIQTVEKTIKARRNFISHLQLCAWGALDGDEGPSRLKRVCTGVSAYQLVTEPSLRCRCGASQNRTLSRW